MTDDLVARIADVLPPVRVSEVVADWPADEREIYRTPDGLSLTETRERLDRLRREKAARAVLDVLGIPVAPRQPGAWDIGDPEPEGVTGLVDETDGCDGCSPHWGKTDSGEYKGYKDGGKVYLSWAELVRRWGPLKEAE
ncbi:hypothetical protein [Kineosporia babensis]|uniref:Uncharacterized protein n=1 Tax=Kineosporia babensis TaxID=499548 RepID=A0A9X1NB61_9ACTN|nr:hypothetical protein [Kineosporia babensis]MCD5310883.1 hypothetical protein [Kineosporia babensis]